MENRNDMDKEKLNELKRLAAAATLGEWAAAAITDDEINDIFAGYYDSHDDHMDTIGFARAVIRAALSTAPQAQAAQQPIGYVDRDMVAKLPRMSDRGYILTSITKVPTEDCDFALYGTPAAPVATSEQDARRLPGCISMTQHDGGLLELQFVSEHASQAFMLDFDTDPSSAAPAAPDEG